MQGTAVVVRCIEVADDCLGIDFDVIDAVGDLPAGPASVAGLGPDGLVAEPSGQGNEAIEGLPLRRLSVLSPAEETER